VVLFTLHTHSTTNLYKSKVVVFVEKVKNTAQFLVKPSCILCKSFKNVVFLQKIKDFEKFLTQFNK